MTQAMRVQLRLMTWRALTMSPYWRRSQLHERCSGPLHGGQEVLSLLGAGGGRGRLQGCHGMTGQHHKRRSADAHGPDQGGVAPDGVTSAGGKQKQEVVLAAQRRFDGLAEESLITRTLRRSEHD